MMPVDRRRAADARFPGEPDLGALDAACARIAPTWPLDRFIAVNPFWEHVDEPFERVAARLAALSGTRLLMSRAWFAEQWQAGRFTHAHLQRALEERASSFSVHRLEQVLAEPAPSVAVRARVMDVVDEGSVGLPPGLRPSWREFVTGSVSQFCASFFDEGQALLPPSRAEGLYATWRRHALTDQRPHRLMGIDGFGALVALLPRTADEMARLALAELAVPAEELEAYLLGLLLDLNGWAAWGAYQRWTARLAGRGDASLRELLIVWLAWEWISLQLVDPARRDAWPRAIARWGRCDAAAVEATAEDWILQRALELAAEDEVARGLCEASSPSAKAPAFQAVFCIDVRSEVFRRALEAACPEAQTLGFAGFFGLPIEYRALGATSARPQLPGLLGARFEANDEGLSPGVAVTRTARLAARAFGEELKASAFSGFSFVEAMGPLAALDLVRETFGRPAQVSAEAAGLTAREDQQRLPRLGGPVGGGVLELGARADLAAGVLRAMSLTHDFARLVVLIGHGSQTRNNPHAAGLDCGACCGQTGEVNARAAAALLNAPEVRAELQKRGLVVPDSTRFIAGLHLTTTDEVRLFEVDDVPPTHAADVSRLSLALAVAGNGARRERAARLDLPARVKRDDRLLLEALQARGSDWAQVRPEWGLADNAAFIVGPRELTRRLDLGGRAFLHDYRFEEDEGFGILELLMTAPLVVAHWINLQYYASTVDNLRYGSGNKVLHNVVGGHLGVFEGNGGDLRIGLPRQSLHDGERWVHTPRRLSVFIAAPREAIEAVLQKHAKVRALVENQWLSLCQVDPVEHEIWARGRGGWHLRALKPSPSR